MTNGLLISTSLDSFSRKLNKYEGKAAESTKKKNIKWEGARLINLTQTNNPESEKNLMRWHTMQTRTC